MVSMVKRLGVFFKKLSNDVSPSFSKKNWTVLSIPLLLKYNSPILFLLLTIPFLPALPCASEIPGIYPSKELIEEIYL
jgi:hypothetical protein